jgi:hypothetical protein
MNDEGDNVYLNVEPLHFASEGIVARRPTALPDLVRYADDTSLLTFAVLLDDTSSPGLPVMEAEARASAQDLGATPCTFVRETSLSPLAFEVVFMLPRERIKIRRHSVSFLTDDGSVVLCRTSSETPMPLALDLLSNSRPPGDILAFIRPSCTLYTVAWDIFRFVTPFQRWRQLADLEIDIMTEIRCLADGLRSTDRTGQCHLLNNLPNVFETNETRARAIGSEIQATHLRRLFVESDLLVNMYF